MADIAGVVISAVACVAQCLSPPGGHRINLWRQFKRNFKILETKLETLTAESRSIQRDVDAAKRNGDGIKENVQIWLKRSEELEVATQKWLERASKIIGDDQASIRKAEETTEAGEIGGEAEIAAAAAGESRAEEKKTAAKKRCFKGLCPNLKSRYQLSKEAETLLEDVVKHLEAGKFDKISYPVIPRDPRLSSKDYEAFESRTSTLKNVISSLSDSNVNIVGIYGMGGIGKTTLAKEVANQSETNKLFDLVIFVEVTEKPDKIKIQREIAGRLGLTLSSEEAEAIRAGKLCQLLKKEKKENEKKILIIFDNIWVHLDLQAIGIPLGDEYKVCKVLLTSRSIDVLERMDSQKSFPVELLDDEEAWQLFKKMSRDNIEGSEFESVAKAVANKCAHLPIVIVTVARALKNKELFAWKDALQKLRIEGIQGSIELSFSYLETDDLKKTILLIGYANITSIDKLLMYGMGVALFEDVNKMEGRRDRVLTLVQQLKDSSLLLDSNTTGEDFSMHDVVHEVAMSIASREAQVLTKLHDELESPDKNALKVCSSVVLKDVKTGELPQVLEGQKLKLLSISGVRSYSLKLHDQFFIRMTELKVLVLYDADLLSLPSSLRFLTNLRALGLYGCQLDDIAIIQHLKKLEILSLKYSYIKQLPEEVGHLTRLKSLDLRDCSRLGVIAPYVLSSLSHLEELYMGDFRGWEEEGLNKDRKNVSLDELKHMSNLTCLEIKIRDAKRFPRDLFFNKLDRYTIKIGQDTRMFHKREIGIPKSCRILSLIKTNIFLNDGHIMQLKKIEVLCLVGSQDMKSVLYGLDIDGFQQLKYLEVADNDNLLCIVDAMKYATNSAFPVLESLFIDNLINLEKICHFQLTTESSFSQLRKIEVKRCAKLENIFSFSMVKRLQLLQSIDIFYCKNIKEIFAIESEDESNSNISEVIDNIELNQLRSLSLNSLPQLKSLEYNSNFSNTLFSGKVALPSLEVLKLDYLKVERIWQNQLVAMSSSTQNLTMLIVCDCNNLRCLFSSSLIRSFVRLQQLQIISCPCLEEIIMVDERTDILFPQLQFLRMKNLKNLSKFFSGDSIEFPSLKELDIDRCPKLREFLLKNISTNSTEISLPFFNEKVALPSLKMLSLWSCNELKCLFSSSMIGSFDQLQYVHIYNCEALEEIMVIDNEDGLRKEERKNNVTFSISNINNYLVMEVQRCRKLKTLFSRNTYRKFLRLESLYISECDLLEEIFDLEGPDLEDKHSEVVITQLSELFIANLPRLKQVWNKDPKRFFSFEKLKEVRIIGCDVLKNIFPASVASSLSQLESLRISECGVEEIVFVGEEEAETNSMFAFPRLISLELRDLPNFTTFFSERYTSCFVEKIFPNLEKLIVEGKSIPMIWHFPGEPFYKVKYLEVTFDESTVTSSLDFLHKFHSVKRLKIAGYLDFEDYDFEAFRQTQELAEIKNLNKCSDLKHILKEESNMDHLIHLQVIDCDTLVNVLMPSSTSFRNLTTLEVYKCKGLTNIVTSSTAKSMGQLREMKIIDCDKIAELVLADEGYEAKDYEIVFGELKKLHLQGLQSLKIFCSANYALKFSSLEDLYVRECPEMKSFSIGNLSTPKLQKVKHGGSLPLKEYWNGDLNTTIHQLHEETYERRRLIMTVAKEDVSSSSNNVETQSSKEGLGQPSMQ